ncbi:hypothetical protein V6C03_10330 [Methyloligella sp. 2.7D]|uniref:hypothetical protein n=1 Tax=unclassified Methyloligella TaxID=2625955 RepID=UPI00157CC247|nr:hypothetical protein [Methyloligella sp. GL2]QKP77767.1 hypothetical protein HT051_10125 [Methyloligella sp. GL2]
MAEQSTSTELNPKEARQGTRPNAMVWVLGISTVAAAVLLYLILAVGWTGAP